MTTVVIGGGLAGALAARALDLSGEEVLVVEEGEQPGGIARPLRRDGYLLEPAVGSVMLPHPALSPLLEGLDVEVRVAPASARRRFVRHRSGTIEVRPGPGVATSPLLSPGGKLRVLAEPFIRRGPGNESLQSFFVRRVGREAGTLVAWLMASGVHAADPSALSMEAAFPALAALEQEHGSLLRGVLARRGSSVRPSTHFVVGGTAQIAAAVARSLGERWRSSWPAHRLEGRTGRWRIHGPETIDCERVIAAVSPDVLSRLHPPAGSRPEERAPVAVVWLGLTARSLPEGFGVLVGPAEGFTALGFLYESSYAPPRAPAEKALVKAIVGGATHPQAVSLSDDELVDRVADELARVLGSSVATDMTHVVRHLPGIPQYTASRARMIRELRATLPTGLDVCGWAYDGVGLSGLATAAARLASP